MSARFSAREIWVGLIVIVAIAGLIGLVGLASDGPGFLAPQRIIEVVFRDAQGLRVGSPVRIAGLDTGNVIDIDVVESKVDGSLRAKVRISLPAKLVKKLRQDVKVTVQPALTGMSHVNIVSSGHSNVPLVPGQEPIVGIETSLFDPIIEHIGLGPGERNDIRHMIAEIRRTVDSAAPRVRQSLASLEETSANIKELSESIRPAIESTVTQVEDLARRIRANTPRVEATLVRMDEMTGQVQGIVAENRENVRQTMASIRDLTASLTDIVGKDRLKVERLLDGLDAMRARSERVLYQADQIAGQIAGILVRGRTEIERAITNVRDATGWANKLVQKIYANPFVLSPLYKPNHEDLRVESAYAAALSFTQGAEELRDATKTLEALATRATNPQQQQEIQQLQQQVLKLTNQLGETSHRIAEAIRPSNGRDRTRRQ
jgi:phospholipid/cholesterol/gamma-HCH transport system substrate-binding protein